MKFGNPFSFFLRPLLLFLLLCAPACRVPRRAAAEPAWDVVVYGGTSAGVTAAVEAARLKKRVLLAAPSGHLGGLTSSGLGATDVGKSKAVGGLAREFYRRIRRWYDRKEAWTRERREDFHDWRMPPGGDVAWTFEPHVAERVFEDLVREAGVRVLYRERLDLEKGVVKEGTRIRALVMESGKVVRGRIFIDASYEGDLMALAGVGYAVGRESNSLYGETLNGVQPGRAEFHQFAVKVDPYVKKGDPSSGLLPGIHAGGPGKRGSGDRRIQAYCFRICATDDPSNRVPWRKPEGYDPREYELLLRNFDAGDRRIPWSLIRVPNRKTDCNNRFAVSTDFIGRNYAYPEGDYETRARIVREHRVYQEGLFWTLAHDPRVPAKVRAYFRKWGLAKDEFTDNGNWPYLLYVREARRMRGVYVMTEKNCRGLVKAEDPVGLGSYNMDSHHVQRYVAGDGGVRNEGDVEVGVPGPYPISYRSLTPKRNECSNLLVPVCLSATHIAYGSIRMEPVFMVLGQSAGDAAVLALDEGKPVQDVPYPELRKLLLERGQVLE